MGRFIAVGALLLLVSFCFSQNVEDVFKNIEKKGKAENASDQWMFDGIYNLAVAQTTLTNWAAGGNNNFNISGVLRQRAGKAFNGWNWFNLLEANLGYNFQQDVTVKTDDRLEFTTRLDRALGESKWNASLFGNIRTQFADGFRNPADTVRISTFMAPAYVSYGLGLTNTSIKDLAIYISPIQVKQTFVLDDSLFEKDQFFKKEIPNVSRFSKGGVRTEMGAFVELIYKKKLQNNVDIFSKLNLFSNYLDRPQNIDVNWDNIIVFKLYKYLSVSFQLQMIYDDDVLVKDTNGDGKANAPALQIRQILGVGFSYSFTNKKS
ncbi:hypothetical protein JCM31826_09470 [Thermaurantimonas aggregans]|uniref:DUF3078 domain-containing protein n=1 Tax=Thermaurantimonas aggregans TaxID=2173829 RepID=A0A401XKA0_9FLAO|nr:DUF3078 domain-containing protein [Thermaurantimonas aggregans]MCX8148343.1 DUF3078 domain-containing protein [Thermaurantimonas aggregans]GCD77465.1 hypothetical protein JCM31826_09470 [Thermaurantimonas aggregans]